MTHDVRDAMRRYLRWLGVLVGLAGPGTAMAQQPHVDSLAKATVKIDSAVKRTTSTLIKRWLAEAKGLVLYRTPVPPPPPPPTPGTFPAGYDPARLGSELLAGDSWQNIVIAGTTDNGFANLSRVLGFAMGSSSFPTNAGMLGVFPDATFGQAVRITNLAGANGMTAQSHSPFTATSNVWASWTIRLQGPDSATPFTAVTATPGESGTYKLAFLFPEGNKVRQGLVLMSSGQLATECPLHGGVGTLAPMVATDSTQPVPAPAGAFKGIYTSTVPTRGGPYASHDMRRSGDWYRLTMNAETISATEYINRFFVLRLTVGGKWQPWAYPVWVGCRVTGGVPARFHDFWLTGNKSGAASLTQWLWLGPFEVSTTKDPYGWHRYGR